MEMQQDNWPSMTVVEKLEWLRQELSAFISHQNAANARLVTRIQAVEEAIAKIDKKDSPPHSG